MHICMYVYLLPLDGQSINILLLLNIFVLGLIFGHHLVGFTDAVKISKVYSADI